MADIFGMSMLGLDVVNDFMDICDKNDAKLLKKTTVIGGRIILRSAKEKCPISIEGHHIRDKEFFGLNRGQLDYLEPGNLKKSLKLKVLKPRIEGEQLVLVGPEVGKKAKHDGWYGRLVENGTSHSAPEPFLRPAYDEKIEEATAKMAEVYNEEWGNTIIEDIEDLGDDLMDGDRY